MSRARSKHWSQIRSAVMGVLLAAVVQAVCGEDPDGTSVRVIFPADKCVLESGKLDLLCVATERKGQVAPRLRVDGKDKSWEPFEAPVLLSRLELRPGRHRITVGAKRLRVYVRGTRDGPDEPSGWPLYRTHPGSATGWKSCTTCHEVTKQDGRADVGAPRGSASCSQCHSPADFELTHFHPQEPLAACHMCHAVHGSGQPSLLRAPVKRLCAECHD